MLLGCHFRKTYLINLIFLQNKILSFGSQIVRGEKQGHTGWKKREGRERRAGWRCSWMPSSHKGASSACSQEHSVWIEKGILGEKKPMLIYFPRAWSTANQTRFRRSRARLNHKSPQKEIPHFHPHRWRCARRETGERMLALSLTTDVIF